MECFAYVLVHGVDVLYSHGRTVERVGTEDAGVEVRLYLNFQTVEKILISKFVEVHQMFGALA